MSKTLQPLTFPLSGSRLIEASAGTGKTYTIATLYLRLILQHGGDAAFAKRLLPPQILVMTFTDAATQELRDRIRVRLVEAANAFRHPDLPCDPLLEALRQDLDSASWGEYAWHLETAAQWMDEAAVMTIHAWCQRMLREHAFDSGSLFDLTVRTNHQELYDLVVRDYWRIHCYPLEEQAAQWVYSHWKHPDHLWERIETFLKQMEVDLPSGAPEHELSLQAWFDHQRNQFTNALSSLKQEARQWVDEVFAMLDHAREHRLFSLPSFNSKVQASIRAAYQSWLDDPDQTMLVLTVAQRKRLTVDGLREVWLDPDQSPVTPALQALVDLPARIERLQRDYEHSLLWHVVDWTRRRFTAEKRQRAEIGFADMLLDLRNALLGEAGARLAATIAQQFPVAMVDEFQDTDPVQYEILDAIYALSSPARQTALILIGDPKQSIYGFRGADIHAYLQARQATHGRHYTLPTNYRSSAAMVAAVNHLFEQAEQRPAGQGAFLFQSAGGTADGMQDAASNPVPFQPVTAHPSALAWHRQGVMQPSLTFWSNEDYPEEWEAAESCASAIVALLNDPTASYIDHNGQQQAIAPGDVAVLVRNRFEAQEIRQALSRRGLRSVYLSNADSVYQSQEALDLQFWLTACLQPQDESSLKAALATPTLGLSLTELDRYRTDEQHWEDVIMQFTAYGKRWRTDGILPMVRQLIHDFELPQRLMQQPQAGERVLTNVLHLSEVLQQQARELDGQRALLQFLQQASVDPADIDDQQILRLESDETLLRVITKHKSKGLEYPFVFLPFVNRYRVFTPRHGFVLASQGKRSFHLHAAKEDVLFRQAESARLAEDLRLLYVALTRARYACWLGVEKPQVEISENNRGSALAYLLGMHSIDDLPACLGAIVDAAPRYQGGQTISLQPFPDIASDVYTPVTTAFQPQVREYSAPPPEPWWVASYSALRTTRDADHTMAPQTAAAQVLRDDEPVPVEPLDHTPQSGMHQLPRGAAMGNFLHDVLERIMQPEHRNAQADENVRAALLEQLAVRHHYDDWLDVLHPWLERLWHTCFRLPDGRSFSFSTLASWQVEMEFWFAARQVNTERLHRLTTRFIRPGAPRPALLQEQVNGLFKGFIDLTFELDGRYYVLDYKSNYLGPDDNSYLADPMWTAMLMHRYDLQYVLYTLALHRHLRSRMSDYDYDKHMGGAIYLFLRGIEGQAQGLVADRPPRALIDKLDALFAGSPTQELA